METTLQRPPTGDPIFGEVVNEIRLDKGLEMREVSAAGFISHSYLCEVEKGRKNPSHMMVEAIAKGLGMPTSHLYLAYANRLNRYGR